MALLLVNAAIKNIEELESHGARDGLKIVLAIRLTISALTSSRASSIDFLAT